MAGDPNPPMDPTEIPLAVMDSDAVDAVWNWGDLLDFSVDRYDPPIFSWDDPDDRPIPSPPSPPPPPAPAPSTSSAERSGHVRKRDPRLVCENFLAGRIPCSCPEVDEMAAEEPEDEAGPATKKPARGSGTRCQVPQCGADISELKGYHRRHRICLQCANAPSVVLDGEHKRYCQQCGKFHLLPDFDEGRRSCRRKLERHNRRRRRRPSDGSNIVLNEEELQGSLLTDVTCDDEIRKEVSNEIAHEMVETVIRNKKVDTQILLDSEDGHGSSPICSLPRYLNEQRSDTVSFAASSLDQVDERIDNAKAALSSTICGNKSVYSSVCPTGRISFKLYDWNPAEFPRRLRHQIFEWLACMPVELEGYIRPGCTILTLFIAMPQFMWGELHQDTCLYVKELINAPGSLLSGRAYFLVYVNNWIVQVMKDGTLSMNVKVDVKTPRLHYVYPTLFEAGKPVEFIACGSNLDQPKFRFLVSFSGKYLVCDSCHAISHGKTDSSDGDEVDFEHEMFRVKISLTDPEVFGPAFIEVENESGLSNFVAILFGSKLICSELEKMEEAFCRCPTATSIMSEIAVTGVSKGLCKLLVSKQTAMSELLLDIAWLLKEPKLDEKEIALSSISTQRITALLNVSVQNGLVSVLELIQHYLEDMTFWAGSDKPVNMTFDTDMRLLMKYMGHARGIYNQRPVDVRSKLDLKASLESVHRLLMPQSDKSEMFCTNLYKIQDVETRMRDDSFLSTRKEESLPLVSTMIADSKKKICSNPGLNQKFTGTSFTLVATVIVLVCFGACVVVLHPHKAGEYAMAVKKRLFGGLLT